MSKASIQTTIANAISKADSSYFFEDYSKQALAVMQALEKAGYKILPAEFPEEIWKQVAGAMRTGRVRPDEHVKDVYQTVQRIASGH